MSITGIAVALAIVFLVLAAVHVVAWLLALIIAVVAVLAALVLGRSTWAGRRL